MTAQTQTSFTGSVMPFTPLTTGSRPSDEGTPQLTRLCRDFGLHVLPWRSKTTPSASNSRGFGYRLASELCPSPAKADDFQFLTPAFDELHELETFVSDNMVDILHNFLFESQAS